MKPLLLPLLALLPACSSTTHSIRPLTNTPPEDVVREWHQRAAAGDPLYFEHMTDNAVFLGTDPSERWVGKEFRDFARPYFDGEEAWTYTPIVQHVSYPPNAEGEEGGMGNVAWVDEILRSESYGLCRGTTVLLKDPETNEWKIAHHSLTFLIPNELAKDITTQIKNHTTQTTPTPPTP